MNKQILVACAAALIVTAPVPEASAFFGTGRIVYDPSNHAQNILTAARTLQQISNQVKQLANEAQMLINQAQNLANLPHSVAADLRTSLARVDALISTARGIAYQVSIIDSEYRRLFPEQYAAAVTSSTVARIIRLGTGLMAGSPTATGNPGRVTVPTPDPARKITPWPRPARRTRAHINA